MEDKKEITIDAKLECIDRALSFVNNQLQERGITVGVRQRIELALEEMLVNISSYAYSDDGGKAKVAVSYPEENLVRIDIWDKGMPYDPTQRPDPDITIPLRDRKIGGLGIFMTKIIMDEMKYEHVEGVNHITMIKDLTLESSF